MVEINKEKIILMLAKIKKDKKSLLVIIIGFIGIILIFFSELLPADEDFSDKDEVLKSGFDVSYKEELEQIIGKVKGVGKVQVMLTFEGSSESIYAKDNSEQFSNDEHKTAQEHIILDKGSAEEGLLLKEKYPNVTGVAVVCEGGGNPTVKNEITQMLKALFGIGSNCISISEMNSWEELI